MKQILYVGSEAAPFAATGGLGDVLGSLPNEVAAAGGDDVDVRVVLPLYGSIREEYRREMTLIAEFEVPLAWRSVYCGIKSLSRDGVTWYFIDNESYFKRDQGLYGYFDDGERFAYFCSAVMKMLRVLSFYPDILHANDWQAALTVIYAKRRFGLMPGYCDIKTVFTIHNIEYQGKYGFEILGDIFGLSEGDRSIVENDGCINLMKGAIQCCDLLTTVSPRYAGEIQGPEYSHGLDEIIRRNSYKLCGILNGIDYRSYNPRTDTALAVPYSSRTPEKKRENKIAFQKEMALPVDPDKPLFAMITRLAEHKGLDLICAAADRILSEDLQFAVLGTGEAGYEQYLRELENRYRDKERSIILFDRAMSRRIYAAADFFIMPSKSEPCGLSQMIASRYGAIPITRETGGLADSIHGYWEERDHLHGNGFTFANYSADELYDRIRAALALYADREKHRRFTIRVMRMDFSWERSAKQYLALYGVNA